MGIPPAGVPPPAVATTKGKESRSVTPEQLRRRKTDVLRLCVAFAIAAKHYLRDEDGVQWEDLIEILPPSFARYEELNTSTYTAEHVSRDPSKSQDHDDTPPPTPVATKRVRPKRSKTKVPSISTPLLLDPHRSVDFEPLQSSATMPLPLM